MRLQVLVVPQVQLLPSVQKLRRRLEALEGRYFQWAQSVLEVLEAQFVQCFLEILEAHHLLGVPLVLGGPLALEVLEVLLLLGAPQDHYFHPHQQDQQHQQGQQGQYFLERLEVQYLQWALEDQCFLEVRLLP